jgi:C4-dicarboxylate-specific signal transduction histidine kinase
VRHKWEKANSGTVAGGALFRSASRYLALSPVATKSIVTTPCGIVGASKTARDITERRKMLAEMEKTRLQLISSDRLSAIGLMASGIAHEINNPLGIIHASSATYWNSAKKGMYPNQLSLRHVRAFFEPPKG